MNTFCPEYKDYDTTNRPMSSSGYYSYMGYWTDECLKKYGIPPSLA
jgi:hypothetical protein